MHINTNSYGSLNQNHAKRIQDTINKSLNEYPRTLLLRADLRLPEINASMYHVDSTLITRFMTSLKAQIDADLQKKQKAGKRVYPCRVRHVWVREFNQDGKKHYHLVLLFNKDTYAYPGNYTSTNGEYSHNLAFMIMEAWVRTLHLHTTLNYQQFYALVAFPTNGYYHLNTNSPDFYAQYSDVINRVNYLAKEYTKDYSDGQRNFGCSQY